MLTCFAPEKLRFREINYLSFITCNNKLIISSLEKYHHKFSNMKTRSFSTGSVKRRSKMMDQIILVHEPNKDFYQKSEEKRVILKHRGVLTEKQLRNIQWDFPLCMDSQKN